MDISQYENNPAYEKITNSDGSIQYVKEADYYSVNAPRDSAGNLGTAKYQQHLIEFDAQGNPVYEIRRSAIKAAQGEKVVTDAEVNYKTGRSRNITYDRQEIKDDKGKVTRVITPKKTEFKDGVRRVFSVDAKQREQQQNIKSEQQKALKDLKEKGYSIEERKQVLALINQGYAYKDININRPPVFTSGRAIITSFKEEEKHPDFKPYSKEHDYYNIDDVTVTEVKTKEPQFTAYLKNPDHPQQKDSMLISADKDWMKSQRYTGEFQKTQRPQDLGKAIYYGTKTGGKRAIASAQNVVEYAKEHKVEAGVTVGLVLIPEIGSTAAGVIRAGKAATKLYKASRYARVGTNVYFGYEGYRFARDFNVRLKTTVNKAETVTVGAGEVATTVAALKVVHATPKTTVKVAQGAKTSYYETKHWYKTYYQFERKIVDKSWTFDKTKGNPIVDAENVVITETMQTQLKPKTIDYYDGKINMQLEEPSVRADARPSKQTRFFPRSYINNWDWSIEFKGQKPQPQTRKIYTAEDYTSQTFLKEPKFNKVKSEVVKPKKTTSEYITIIDKNRALFEVRDVRGEVIFSVKRKVGSSKKLYTFAEPVSAVATELGQYEVEVNTKRTPFMDEKGRIKDPRGSDRFGLRDAKPNLGYDVKPSVEPEFSFKGRGITGDKRGRKLKPTDRFNVKPKDKPDEDLDFNIKNLQAQKQDVSVTQKQIPRQIAKQKKRRYDIIDITDIDITDPIKPRRDNKPNPDPKPPTPSVPIGGFPDIKLPTFNRQTDKSYSSSKVKQPKAYTPQTAAAILGIHGPKPPKIAIKSGLGFRPIVKPKKKKRGLLL